MKHTFKNILTGTTSLAAILLLSACAGIMDNISQVGKTPQVTKIENPVAQPGYKPLTMPVQEEVQNSQPNSLWQAKRQTFFKDQRAAKVGDIVTVTIAINDTANLQNETDRSKTGTENMGLPNFLGVSESQLDKVLPDAVNPAKLVGMNSASTSNGTGKIQRSEAINLKLAATVLQLLPNGNFVIQGRQQVVVNNEMRDLQLQGVIRPEDILNDNTISYEKIAEARISYGGKGNLTNLQQPAYGQQLYDAVAPF
jgi:flagellar L-ring protein precursor FlgH